MTKQLLYERNKLYEWLLKALEYNSDWTKEEIKSYVDQKIKECASNDKDI